VGYNYTNNKGEIIFFIGGQAMKRFIVYCLLLTVGVFFLGGCNSPDDDPLGPGYTPGGEEVIYSWGSPGYKAGPEHGDDPYKGYVLTLAECQDVTGSLKSINNYGTVTIEATLYTDDNGTTKATQADGLGMFNILGAANNWNDKLLVASSTWNMSVDGESSGIVDPDKTTMPTHVLVQTKTGTDEEGGPSGIKSIEIRKVTFTPKKAGSVLLEKVYGSAVAVNGDTITFTNAGNSDGAAFYKFTASELSGLNTKTVTVAYTVVGYNTTDATVEQQLVIQAAGSGNNEANTGSDAQWYPILTTPSGTFILNGSDLLTRASSFSPSFTLTGFRIANNGNTSDDGKTRQATYKLIINSITVQ
jgi:hypothetical protein